MIKTKTKTSESLMTERLRSKNNEVVVTKKFALQMMNLQRKDKMERLLKDKSSRWSREPSFF